MPSVDASPKHELSNAFHTSRGRDVIVQTDKERGTLNYLNCFLVRRIQSDQILSVLESDS